MKPWLALVVVAAIALACRQPDTSGRVRVSGNVEATEVQVAPEVAGRILELHVAEGDRVNQGDLVARLDTTDTELQLQRGRADRAVADAQLRLLRAGSRSEDIRQADAQAAAAEADVTATAADLKAAELDLQRFTSLLDANAGSRKQRDDAQARVDVARERQRAAQDRARAAREGVARLRSGARPEELETARARVAAADAQIAALQQNLAYARVVAPVAGVVTQKLADAGELIAPRMPIVVITDLDHAWANVYVDEPIVPRLRVGDAATLFTDAGGPGVKGTISFISERAEFTPRNVQTADDRSKLVYRVKVSVDNSDGLFKAGMPVEAEILFVR